MRVLVVDRHRLARTAIRHLLLAEGAAQSVEDAGTVGEWLEARGPLDPDVVVLGESDPQLIRATAAAAPAARIVVLGLEDDWNYARRALHAGASGYVPRDRANGELVEALHTVARGGEYASRYVEPPPVR